MQNIKNIVRRKKQEIDTRQKTFINTVKHSTIEKNLLREKKRLCEQKKRKNLGRYNLKRKQQIVDRKIRQQRLLQQRLQQPQERLVEPRHLLNSTKSCNNNNDIDFVETELDKCDKNNSLVGNVEVNSIVDINKISTPIEYFTKLDSSKNIKCMFIIEELTKDIYDNIQTLLNEKENLYVLCCTQHTNEFKESDRFLFVNKYDSHITYCNVLITDNLTNHQKRFVEKYGILYFKNIHSIINLKLYIVANCSLFNNAGYCVRTQELLHNMEEYIISLNPIRVGNSKYINNTNNIYNSRNLLLFDINRIKILITLFNVKDVILPSDCKNFLPIYEDFTSSSIEVKYTYEMRGLWFLSGLSKYEYMKENNLSYPKNGMNWMNNEKEKEIKAMNCTDNIIFITDEQKEYCINELGVDISNKNTTIIYNAVNPNNKIEYNKVNDDIFTVGYFGSITHYEGIQNLIDVIDKLSSKYNIKLLLIGKKTVDITLNKNVQYIEWLERSELLQYYNKIDLFCIPRVPYKVCEIISPIKPFDMLYNKFPLLMSDCETLKHIANNGKNCMLFKKGDNDDLYNKIEQVIVDGYDVSLLENGYNFIMNERTWDIQQKKLSNLYKKTLLIASHDFKFITNTINQLNNNFNIVLDKWSGHNKHDINKSLRLLKQADVILCEWCLGNAVFYSNNKLKHQKLFIRIHRVESKTEYIKELNINNVDTIFYVSPSWNYITQTEYSYDTFKDTKYFYNDLFDTFRPNYSLIKTVVSKDNINIGMCGILPFELKNPLKIIQILDELKNKYTITFHLFGKTPKQLQWIIRKYPDEEKNYMLLEQYLNKNTTLIKYGHVNNDELYKYFCKIDFLFITSNVESFHKSALEALMAGVIPVFYGDYVNKYFCKMNWLNDFCFDDIIEIESFIAYIITLPNKLKYLKPIIDNYWNKYNTLTISNSLYNKIYNVNTECKRILLCFNSNLNYLDGSITFMDNLITTLMNTYKYKINIILSNQTNIYATKREYFNNIEHYYVLNKNETIEGVINRYSKCFDLYKIFIRGFSIRSDKIYTNIKSKIYYYMINNITINDTNINYITQTDVLKKKYKNKINHILYPTCIPVINEELYKTRDKIEVVYCGTIRKEFLSLELLEVLNKISSNAKFSINIIISKIHADNIYKTNIEKVLNKLQKKTNVRILYKLPNKDVKNILKKCHYGFNFKDTKDDQEGEISTKIVEFLNYNIKPIINIGCDEEIFFSNGYPFMLELSSITNKTDDIINKMINHKNTNADVWINKDVHNKYTYDNYIRTIKEIFG